MSVPSSKQGYVVADQSPPSMEEKFSQRKTKTKTTNSGLNLKATELRLGLPGSESPERDHDHDHDHVVVVDDKIKNLYSSLGMMVKSSSILVSGAKRGFSDASSVVVKDQSPVLLSPKPLLDEKKKPLISAPPPPPANKEQVVGWPPIRSFRKNSMVTTTQPQKNDDDHVDAEATKCGCLYVKVSMDGAPYLRKVDLRNFGTYRELSSALEKMFTCFTISQFGSHGVSSHDKLSESRLMDLLHGSEYVLTYEDKDGDWMLVGDVPWKMFMDSCKRLRIMKSSEAIGLAPRAMEKCKSRN